MRNLQWKMQESFYFPGHIGVPQDAQSVKVKAGFTEKRTDDAVRLTGIYHIAAKINFSEGDRGDELPDAAIFIDDVELEGLQGYFEYAVPLNIDLPPEVGHPMHVHAKDVKTTVDGEGVLQISWDVDCVYGEESNKKMADGKEREAQATENEVAKKELDVTNEQKETAAAPKETTLVQAEAKTEEQTSSKQVSQSEVNVGELETDGKEQQEKQYEAVAEAAGKKTESVEAVSTPKTEAKVAVTDRTSAAKPEEAAGKPATEETLEALAESVERTEVATSVNEPILEEQTAGETHVATYDSSSFTGGDDMLSYIASLQDEWTTTTFRSNDVFV
ncbi:hypothetical protein [Sporosarcina sp. Te-1]|uniref:hypothetical protein n=1 Tax=Sporosarcina sp. Te-1 TaxID=2818390 RepID=UPI001A9EA017|nr:hypothetical protein [Sporosarcina sp. Te-1]QTD41561.1 hypothetical protein J3U78_01485 [Sporosarcina sp. Te-1]